MEQKIRDEASKGAEGTHAVDPVLLDFHRFLVALPTSSAKRCGVSCLQGYAQVLLTTQLSH